jgi:hypothetical protein
VLSTDNGANYAGAEVQHYLERNQIIHLRNVPRTPQHNAWVERGHREIKERAGFENPRRGGRNINDTLGSVRSRLEAARSYLEEKPRRSRGDLSARELDRSLPAAEHFVDRACFYETTCRAIEAATADAKNARARRRAEREAIFATMQQFQLIQRTQGGVPFTGVVCETVS